MAHAPPISSVEREGRALVERLGGRWTPKGGMCRCPAHDDRHPSLSVRPGRSRLLFHCFAGCDPAVILQALASSGLIRPGRRDDFRTGPAVAPASDLAAVARRLWGAAREAAGTPAAGYLAARGLDASSAELRFHPRTPCGPAPLTRFRPAIIAAVRDGSGLVAVHRTFLAPSGLRVAAVRHPKRGFGRFGRGAVRLGGLASRLGLAEGIESALSASLLFGVPCWAVLGAERFPLAALPEEVRELLLFLDNDAGGRRAETLAREAFSSRLSVTAYYPRRAGDDWNDVLRASARARRGI